MGHLYHGYVISLELLQLVPSRRKPTEPGPTKPLRTRQRANSPAADRCQQRAMSRLGHVISGILEINGNLFLSSPPM